MRPPIVMGVLNVTPDSFSDGGLHLDPDVAAAHGQALVAAGADIVDVGGEATGPRATPVSAEVELGRVLPVIERLVRAQVPVSIDTTKAEVARAAVRAGARYVNDLSGGLFDPEMAHAMAELDATYICGHLRGHSIQDVFAREQPITWLDVADELELRLSALGPDVRARTWVDPGLGFGKGADPITNLELLGRAGDLGRRLGQPVLVGPSRKRFLRTLVGSAAPTMDELDRATVDACLAAVRAGAHALRVHNVALLRTALTVYTK